MLLQKLSRLRWWKLAFITAFGTFAFCEYLVYYLVIALCSWPAEDANSLRVFLIADTHLLGIRRGHWFDKLRREWQMHRAFVSAAAIHRPDIVFFLGDLFDEGQWSGAEEFRVYADRLRELFPLPPGAKLYAAAGNHDVGFHYAIRPSVLGRFEEEYKSPSVRLVSIKGSHFVLINSMAFEEDGCRFCMDAEKRLKDLNATMECLRNPEFSYRCQILLNDWKESLDTDNESIRLGYSRPILLQHFPLWRSSDADCDEEDGAPSEKEKYAKLRPRWDALSSTASDDLKRFLRPRGAFDGHTHHGCRTWHGDFWEWTISSFSWRNRPNPAFLMAQISPSNLAVSKCFLPREPTVIRIYIAAGLALIFSLLSRCSIPQRLRRREKKP